jgi:hypothetical protein
MFEATVSTMVLETGDNTRIIDFGTSHMSLEMFKF